MSVIRLSPGQRRQLRAALAPATELDHFRRLLALLELGRGEPVAAIGRTAYRRRQPNALASAHVGSDNTPNAGGAAGPR